MDSETLQSFQEQHHLWLQRRLWSSYILFTKSKITNLCQKVGQSYILAFYIYHVRQLNIYFNELYIYIYNHLM